MKKIFALVFVLAFALCPMTCALAADCSAVSCVASEADENGIYTISVELEDCAGIAMIQFALKYDPELVECVSAECGALLTDTEEPTINTGIPGEIYFVWDALEALESDGQLMVLQMRLLSETPAELSFDFEEDFIFATDDFTEIELFTNDCTVGEIAEEESVGDEAGVKELSSERDSSRNYTWIIFAIAGLAVITVVIIVVLRVKKLPQGKH